jgi:hypothetical protein
MYSQAAATPEGDQGTVHEELARLTLVLDKVQNK